MIIKAGDLVTCRTESIIASGGLPHYPVSEMRLPENVNDDVTPVPPRVGVTEVIQTQLLLINPVYFPEEHTCNLK